jgi:hypothetical protein
LVWWSYDNYGYGSGYMVEDYYGYGSGGLMDCIIILVVVVLCHS